jgi:ABC-type glycerol-3-phosphate transport system permease component
MLKSKGRNACQLLQHEEAALRRPVTLVAPYDLHIKHWLFFLCLFIYVSIYLFPVYWTVLSVTQRQNSNEWLDGNKQSIRKTVE